MNRCSLLLLSCFCAGLVAAQTPKKITGGPMLGHTTMRSAEIWLQCTASVTIARVLYHDEKRTGTEDTASFHLQGGQFNTGKCVLTGLEPGHTYQYAVYLNNGSKYVAAGKLTTQQLWQYRQPPPDFNFLTGSCAYFNEPAYDRPGKPYGGDSSIFKQMAKENAAFALWLGDNWYTREVDYFSEWGLWYRAGRDRCLPVLHDFLAKMPQYAIWDDHDYGPNDADQSYQLKETSRDIFMNYWCNPSYGLNGKGVYTKLTWNDADIFMLDDRWFRSDDNMADTINNKPNPDKKMLGDEQMAWLKNNLLFSNHNNQVNFRIIVLGSQVLNAYSPYDCFRHYPVEFTEMLEFIKANHINNIVFLSGDRHHSEIIKLDRPGAYPLYDITVSPFTSGISKTHGIETDNPSRIGKEIDEQNYARFSITGKGPDRTLTVMFMGLHGDQLGEWHVKKADLE